MRKLLSPTPATVRSSSSRWPERCSC